jgi:membrane associated rhomboid family serine protease
MVLFSPRKLILYGTLLVVSSFVLAMLLFTRAVPSTFFLCFLAFAASTFGTVLGMVGAVYIVKFEREAKQEEYE